MFQSNSYVNNITPECLNHSHKTNKYRQMNPNHANQYIDLNEEQHEIEFQDEDFQDNKLFQPSIFLKLFFAYLYFTQGLVISLSATIPYTYLQLPSYDVMAIFNASLLPYSFKFIIAPLIEKYTYFKYGKRKFWIVMSQVLTAGIVVASSFFSELENSSDMALFLLVGNFFMTLQDISLDSLAKKQLRHAHIVGMISATNQLIGVILGSMFLLKLTSYQFAESISLSQPIMSLSALIKIMSVAIFTPSIFIHFFFKETSLRLEYESTQASLGQIICSYRTFFVWKGKYFRTVLYFLIVQQGFNFFLAGYDYQLVKAGFSRNINNTIQNVVAIPISLMVCFMTSKIQPFGVKRGLVIASLGQLSIFIYLRVFFPLNVYSIAIATLFTGILGTWISMIGTIFIYQFPLHKYTGMFITLLASTANLGGSVALHTKILAQSSWWLMSWVGIVLQIFIIVFFYLFFLDWKDRGIIQIKQILESQKYSGQSQNQNQSDYKN